MRSEKLYVSAAWGCFGQRQRSQKYEKVKAYSIVRKRAGS